MLVWAAFAFYCLAVAAPLLLLHFCHNRERRTHSKLLPPPGPPGWPVVGNLFDVGYKLQETFLELQQKHGAVFMLRLGAVNMVVIASASAATELFKKHDLGFCNRHLMEVMKMGEDYNSATVTRPVGPYWRMIRRLYATELLSRTAVTNTEGSRRKCVQQMIQWVSAEGKESTSVELRHLLFVSLFNLMGNLLFSRDLLDLKSVDGNEFYRTMGEIVEITLKPNAADFFPWLRKLDLQNLNKRMKNATDTLINIIDGFAKEHRRHMDSVHKKDEVKDFWTVLQEFEGNGKDEPRKMSDRQINLLIIELFVGSTETTTSTIEWAMTELLRNPEVMQKVNTEIYHVIGYDRKIQESDIENLPYLSAVIKETMRLHPSTPFLVPRTVAKDTGFMGCMIPKGAQIMVNAWGIGRDLAVWSDPFTFDPDRFLGTDIDYRGQHFGLIPFGSGRRICPGLSMAHQVLHIMLGSLLQSFDWALESGVTPETIDMGEALGITLRKSIPLKVIPTPSALAKH
ncbi:cytochrome P450 76A2-like [Papaver somniferum]|uniref:cytochrome P450 76A2-like n=1 Tax=Papaver somniferum TaxID=3469 RepID=UPI000E704C6F|nr:cytochrome P450 76A2-like [Papaver somniferum]